MPDQSMPLDTVFHALADPTRRAVIQRLSDGAATVTELSEPFDMALQSFVQHLKVLEDCGLINSRKVGRVRMCHIAPNKLDGAQEWISEVHIAWEKRVELDPRVGGNFVISEQRGDTLAEHFGEFLQIDRPHRLVFGYNMDREDELTVVTVEIVATEDGCQLTLSHEIDPKWAHMIDLARAGWTTILEGLATVV